MKLSLLHVIFAVLLLSPLLIDAQKERKVPKNIDVGKTTEEVLSKTIDEKTRKEMVQMRGKLAVLSCLTLIKLHYSRNPKVIAHQLQSFGYPKSQRKQLNEKFLYSNLDYCMTVIDEDDFNLIINNLKQEETIIKKIRQNLAITLPQVKELIGKSLELTKRQQDLRTYILKDLQFDMENHIKTESEIFMKMDEIENEMKHGGFRLDKMTYGVKLYGGLFVIILVGIICVASINGKKYRRKWIEMVSRRVIEEELRKEEYEESKKKKGGDNKDEKKGKEKKTHDEKNKQDKKNE